MLSYSAPMLACYFLLGPTYNIVPTLYAKYFGLQLTTVAMVVLCARVLDAIADPLIGYLSDRHRMAGGNRKTWVLAGALLMIVAAYSLFSPPARPSAGYYLVWNLSFFIAYSLMEIPHVTWGSELTRDYETRSTVFSFRSAAVFCGFILWAGFPLLPFFTTTEFTPDVLCKIAHAGTALLIATLAWAAWRAPNGTPLVPHMPDAWRQVARSVLLNRPLLLLLAAYLFCVLGLGMWQALLFLYLDSYLGQGSEFALIQLLANVVGLATIPAWKHLCGRCEKSTVWLMSLVLFVIFNGAFLMLERQAPVWQPLGLIALIHACISCLYMIVPSMLSDVVDYGEWKFKQNRGATYFALNNLLAKSGFGVGGAMSLSIAGHYGVDATRSMQSAEAITGLQLAYVAMPIGLVLLSAAFAWMTPIDRHRHLIVRRVIERRAQRGPAPIATQSGIDNDSAVRQPV